MRKTLLRYSLHSDFIIYLIRILIGFSIGYFLYISFPQYSVTWTLISIVLVISPDDKEATQIAIDRTKSNFIGSATGILFYFTNLPEMWSMLFGVITSVAICRLFNVLSVARTAIKIIRGCPGTFCMRHNWLYNWFTCDPYDELFY